VIPQLTTAFKVAGFVLRSLKITDCYLLFHPYDLLFRVLVTNRLLLPRA
jgi:hypothetical protein